MINPFFELKKSLSVYYPNVEDSELNDITQDLIDFYTVAVKAFLRNEETGTN